MSWKALAWAEQVGEDRGLPANRRFVLFLLANLADEQWSCFPSQEFLARKSGLTERTVRESLKELKSEELFVVEDRRNKHGGRVGNRYYLREHARHEESPKGRDRQPTGSAGSPVFPGMAVEEDTSGRAIEPVDNLPEGISGRRFSPGMAVEEDTSGRESYRKFTPSLPEAASGPAREVYVRPSLTTTRTTTSSSSPPPGTSSPEHSRPMEDEEDSSVDRASVSPASGGDDRGTHRGVDLGRLQTHVHRSLDGVQVDERLLCRMVDEVFDAARGPVKMPQRLAEVAVSNAPSHWREWLRSKQHPEAETPEGGVTGPCPIPAHAGFGYRRSNCPCCRGVSGEWEFPAVVTPAVFEALPEAHRRNAVAAGVEVTVEATEEQMRRTRAVPVASGAVA